MKLWRCPSTALLALLAMFATMLPQTLWACPMTGQIGTVETMCKMASAANTAAAPSMRCTHLGGKCCKPISIPPQQGDDKNHPTAALTPDLSTSHFHAPTLISIEYPVVIRAQELQVSPTFQSWLALFRNSPPPLKAGHRTTSASGRAPPVL